MSRRYRMETQELAAAEAMGPARVPPKPRPAAGVILARDAEAGPEVLLVRRRADVGFAAGAYVFPGGTLDAADADAAWEDWLDEPPGDAVAGAADLEGPSARTFVVAALRELFEETGVLLASGTPPGHDALAQERQALVAGRRLFLDIVSGLGLRLAGDRLLLCARWITPESLSRRYDARFFLAAAPPDTQVSAELGELVEHVWIKPGEALERYFDYDFRMLFPTARTLGWLEAGASVTEWREHFRSAAVEPILPRLRRVEGEVIPVMPGEPRYDEREGDG
ncbi:MAG: NUDIX domain-containing protein [Gemmatimonadota bacterium]|nr:MAG: NUDIX domain-containing protein [Gemmatimonadota bacterium]